jgi:hypothetical protein
MISQEQLAFFIIAFTFIIDSCSQFLWTVTFAINTVLTQGGSCAVFSSVNRSDLQGVMKDLLDVNR